MPEAILTKRHPLLYAAAVRIHGEADSFLCTRATEHRLDHVEKNFMPHLPNLEGADGQEMGNLRMNVGFFVKHSMGKA